jgi:hypothetical protein
MGQPNVINGIHYDSEEYQYFKSLLVKGLLSLYESFETQGI